MFSLEIAKLTGKEVFNIHRDIRNMLAGLDDPVLDDVLFDIRTMLDQLDLTSAGFSANLPDAYGHTLLMKSTTNHRANRFSVSMLIRISTPLVVYADFLKRVPKVLGGAASNFGSCYTASNGKQNPCWNSLKCTQRSFPPSTH